MDMRPLQASLEAIERVCTPEKAHVQSGEKASPKNEAGNKQPSTGAMKQVPKKVHFKKSCKLCINHRHEKDGMVKADFRATKKAGKKPNPEKQSFAQLSKKLDKLEMTLNSLSAMDSCDHPILN